MYNRVSINVKSVSLGIIITIITINSSSICFLDPISIRLFFFFNSSLISYPTFASSRIAIDPRTSRFNFPFECNI